MDAGVQGGNLDMAKLKEATELASSLSGEGKTGSSITVKEGAVVSDSATLSGLMAGGEADMPFARQLRILARPQDIALGFSEDGNAVNVVAALDAAREIGLLTLGLAGGDGGRMKQSKLDFAFIVKAHDPLVIQETHETLYHVLWEQVHIFFEHEGLLE